MKKYDISGMSCAACSARVESAVKKLDGVTGCSVNLLTNSMGVEGDVTPEAVMKAVEGAGYGAKESGAAGGNARAQAASDSSSEDKEIAVLSKRLITSLGFLAVLMYVSMGHMMFGFPLPPFLHGNRVAQGLLQLLLAASVMIINQKFFTAGFKSLVQRAPNMDSLVALGSGASFIWSVIVLFLMTGDFPALSDMSGFYFESAAMIVTLITVGKLLEAKAKGKTTTALKNLIRLTPKTATIERDGSEVVISIEELNAGDIFVVRPGESIAADGIVIEGATAVDESSLTGESLPIDKSEGSAVNAATINLSGFIKCRALRVGKDTSLAKIIELVSDAAATKAPVAKIADRVSGVFVPVVIVIAAAAAFVWLFAGESVSFALARGISVLVISCPCALGLATPVAIMVAGGVGAKNGILFKTSEAIETAGRVNIVALDKTGTITSGNPAVTDIITAAGISETELLQSAYALEVKSEHPLAKAVVKKAQSEGLTAQAVQDFKAHAGLGVTATLDGTEIFGGSLRFIEEKAVVTDEMRNAAETLSAEGKTPLAFVRGKSVIGIIAVADTIKDDSAEAVERLKKMGIKVVMLTGDNKRAASAVGKEVGADEVIAELLPDGKADAVGRLKRFGKVAMVGDGINDAPALTAADAGIAIGAGTDIAVDAGGIILMNSRLSDVPAAISLSRAALRNIHENLFWAFFYNVIGIPLAAGAYTRLFGWSMSPMFGAAAMSLSSFCVVMNALRLNLLDIKNGRRDIRRKAAQFTIAESQPESRNEKKIEESFEKNLTGKEGNPMTKMLKIEGMMCSHCEAAVKKALESVDGVASAVPSSKAGTAYVTMNKDVPDDALKSAVEAADYTVTGIEQGEG
ncbi:MAG: heavy metal translocating P-type ATPase [Treponema sp.]